MTNFIVFRPDSMPVVRQGIHLKNFLGQKMKIAPKFLWRISKKN